MRKVAIWIFAIMLALYGVIAITTQPVDTSGEPEQLEKMDYLDMENDTVYYVEELVILDSVASLENSSALYLIVMFEDAEGNHVVANMPVNSDDEEIYDDVCDYLADDNQGYGDLVISAYVQTEDFVDVDDKLMDYYNEYILNYELYTGDDVLARRADQFAYLCDEDGDPYATINGASTVGKVVGVVCIVAAVLMIAGTLRKPKAKKQAQPADGYYQPVPPMDNHRQG